MSLPVCGKAADTWTRLTLSGLLSQVGTEWRKVAKKLEGEEIFEALDKVERLEVYQVRVSQRYRQAPVCPTTTSVAPSWSLRLAPFPVTAGVPEGA